MICPFTFTGCLPCYYLELTSKPYSRWHIRNEYVKGGGETQYIGIKDNIVIIETSLTEKLNQEIEFPVKLGLYCPCDIVILV